MLENEAFGAILRWFPLNREQLIMRKTAAFSAILLITIVGCSPSPSPAPSLTPSPGPGNAMTTPTTDSASDFQTTTTGLKYKVLEEGTGNFPTADDTVRVHYRGWLPNPGNPDNGTEFDSSYKRDEPVKFPLSGVIPGWTEGMQLVSEGGKIQLEVPPDLGYGAQGAGGAIPPNATLRFEVELLEVVQPPKPGPVDAGAPEEFSKTESGLKYRIRRKGNGSNPTASDMVTVHYRGWLPDPSDPTTGHEFDSSYGRGEATSFPLNGVIAGWTEGLQLVSEGGMIELDIPAAMAYGDRDMGDIPPNSDLRFIVELLKVGR